MSRYKLHGVLTAEDLKLYHSLPLEERPKLIFDGDQTIAADHINPYLFDAPDILIDRRPQPLCDVPRMIYGNKPVDGGNLIIETRRLSSARTARKEIYPTSDRRRRVHQQSAAILSVAGRRNTERNSLDAGCLQTRRSSSSVSIGEQKGSNSR